MTSERREVSTYVSATRIIHTSLTSNKLILQFWLYKIPVTTTLGYFIIFVRLSLRLTMILYLTFYHLVTLIQNISVWKIWQGFRLFPCIDGHPKSHLNVTKLYSDIGVVYRHWPLKEDTFNCSPVSSWKQVLGPEQVPAWLCSPLHGHSMQDTFHFEYTI